MAKPFARRFYDSPAWRRCRKSYIAKRQGIDGGLCEMCKDDVGYIVDHITELTPDNIDDPYITLHFRNLQYLCLSCHNKKTFGDKDERKFIFDEDGMFIPILPPLDEG